MTTAPVAGPLAAALADRYRIEREVGQGGMATVYLAEDLKHRRRVAVKVLRPDLAQSLGAGRFLREIEIAAKLSHPHILPLHDSGDAGGFLYYVMPFVEGESLRQRLTREGALPPADAARFLREIADALAHAHAYGVVHRDIKPENVMLSGRHALVMDFGVAKAVREAAGEGLTTVGMTLGTPAYMAPEQAIADPAIDHRADIYALGAVGYEMLTGRPLYAGMSPHQVLAAHITRPPDPIPVAVAGHAVPPVFAALIMRCLEKRPAERPQDAGDLVALLEGVATPSGGTTPPHIAPAAGGGAEAAARHAHPLRVALLFTAAAALVLGIVAFLTYRLGLPGWVVGAAALLLLIGFPIMVITGLQERRRALARTTAVSVQPVESAVARHFTWRKAILGGVAAFGGLTLLAAAYTAMRVLGIGPVGTLVASGALAERDRLVLAEFENRTADSTLAGSLTEALRVDLSQSPTVRLVDAADVADVLARMQRPPDTRVTFEVAREVAERSGVKGIVTGQVDPVGTGYVLSASVLSAADGRSLVSVRETADDAGKLLAAIDRLSGKLRERIGESLVSIRDTPPLEQVTTSSLAALRKYSEGNRLVDLGLSEAAIPVLEDAIALDSNFAMAWRKLAVAVGNSFGSRAREAAASTRAYELRDRLPAAERDLATAYYYGTVEGDLEKEGAAYRSLLEREPDNATALNNLALTYNVRRRYAAAETLAVRALGTGTAEQYLFQAMVAQIGQGDLDAARSTAARARDSLPPGTPAARQFSAFLATALGDYAAADSVYRQVRRESSGNLEYQTRTADALASLTELRGRVREAMQFQRERMATAEARRLPEDYIAGAAQLALVAVRYRADPTGALTIIQDALAKYPLSSMPPANRPYLRVAEVYAAAGRPEQARRFLREYEASVPAGIQRTDPERPGVYGAVLEAEGRLQDALEAYRGWDQVSGMCIICGSLERARVYDRMGEADSARALYERFAVTPSVGFLGLRRTTGLAAAYKRLGELYETAGNRQRAAEYYGKFVELWKEADPELQPGVVEVRRRLGRLAQEPGA